MCEFDRVAGSTVPDQAPAGGALEAPPHSLNTGLIAEAENVVRDGTLSKLDSEMVLDLVRELRESAAAPPLWAQVSADHERRLKALEALAERVLAMGAVNDGAVDE